ncbi:sigma-54-dependent Fis family transcriptional regulator [Alkalihalobacterium alkalinitrilicum]|uniref:sigma-54-dependent Fis family transcriptional regulator n=1 Tax=Alkalihalobacterium alkalinitrilicum TaxID=427920 RepID=UPI000994CA4D|nr:sigma-54-dependent Fis family transcriptional regulator [Alkalihalobacterium alkalinitrilicum]
MLNKPVIKVFDEFYQTEKNTVQSWERFHTEGQIPDFIRPIIASSWERCKQTGVNPYTKKPLIVYQDEFLQEKREKNRILLDAVLPLFQELHHDLAWFITDQEGVILERKTGRSNLLKKVSDLNFVPGADISEQASGTNATGIALIEKMPVQIFAGEHFFQSFHPYVASAIPIHDPVSKQILGVLHMGAEKNIVPAHDTFLLLQQVKKIEQLIGTEVVNQNMFSLEKTFNMINEPFILFDMKGTIVRCNDAAKYFFHIHSGDSLPMMLNSPFIIQQWEGLLSSGIQDVCQIKGDEWKFRIQPYKRGSEIVGGMILFQKKSLSLPTSSEKRNQTRYQFSDIMTQDESMLKIIKLTKKAAFSNKSVLITGETGTGKEILAQSIHSYGSRQQGPFIEVNCGAIPRDLVASELFGYEGGAFTGAKSKGKKGKFLLADKGTIFLDEIGDLPLDVQVYLLRILEERTVIPVGGSQPIPINVRVVAATHKNLEVEVQKGNFRADLYHRLNIISFAVPSLRERSSDIPLLVHYFLNKSREGNRTPVMDNGVMEALCAFDWPGNIRQLKNAIEKMLFNADEQHIQLKDLPSEIQSAISLYPVQEEKVSTTESGLEESIYKRNINKTILIQALKQANGNITQAGRILNVSRWTIYNKMKKYELRN